MFAILGGGFGLYGYLPALIEGCGETVMLPERYRERLVARADVGRYVDRIEWRRDEAALLDEAEAVIIARRPVEQPDLAQQWLSRDNIKKILLEKPLAPTPALSTTLLDALEESGKTFRIGYNFRLTQWGQTLLKNPQAPPSITWTFRAHHYANNLQNWKRVDGEGGGALRFFGIHLIALLAELGFNKVSSSKLLRKAPGDTSKWEATFTDGKREAHIFVDADNPNTSFAVNDNPPLKGPFDEAVPVGSLDGRVSLLTALCQDLCHGEPSFYPWYRDSIDLWAKIEQQTQHD